MSRCFNRKPLVDRFHKRLSKWKSKTLSIGGRLTLIKAVLGSLGVYFFSSYKAPKSVISELESLIRSFFWGGSKKDRKIAWVAWEKVISPRDQGGLGIGSLRVSNLAMLAKWWWRFLNEEDSLWCKVIRSLHGLDGGLIDNSTSSLKSGCWFNVLKLKDDLCDIGINLTSLFKKKIGNGLSTRFWLDPCLVSDRSPIPNNNSRNNLVPSSDLLGLGINHSEPMFPQGISLQWVWSRQLRSTAEKIELGDLISLVSELRLCDTQDTWECLIDSSSVFSVKGMRLYITCSTHTHAKNFQPTRWNNLLPIKIYIFSWRLSLNRLPTRSILDYRGVDLDSVLCPSCHDAIETKEHICISCEVAKEVWSLIFKWWDIQLNTPIDLLKTISLADEDVISRPFSRFFDVVVQTILWHLWRFRNEMVFTARRPSKNLLLSEIKLASFSWISSRHKRISLNRVEWFINPCKAISISHL
ncbi:RNA-directed DNA polymerase, eukaryota, reverse transcriptase zinc-binding domain protein [Tanacetum coccineum]